VARTLADRLIAELFSTPLIVDPDERSKTGA